MCGEDIDPNLLTIDTSDYPKYCTPHCRVLHFQSNKKTFNAQNLGAEL